MFFFRNMKYAFLYRHSGNRMAIIRLEATRLANESDKAVTQVVRERRLHVN